MEDYVKVIFPKTTYKDYTNKLEEYAKELNETVIINTRKKLKYTKWIAFVICLLCIGLRLLVAKFVPSPINAILILCLTLVFIFTIGVAYIVCSLLWDDCHNLCIDYLTDATYGIAKIETINRKNKMVSFLKDDLGKCFKQLDKIRSSENNKIKYIYWNINEILYRYINDKKYDEYYFVIRKHLTQEEFDTFTRNPKVVDFTVLDTVVGRFKPLEIKDKEIKCEEFREVYQ